MRLVKALLLGIVELVALGWVAGLVCVAYLEVVSSSSPFEPTMPESAIIAPLWGWLLVAGGLATAAAVLASVVRARHPGREPRWAFRTTLVVLPVAFSAQLVYSGAQWSSLPDAVIVAGCGLCAAASIAAFILTRRQDLLDAEAAQSS